MLHEPADASSKDHAAEYKKILGMKMFVFYTIFYAGFVAINVLAPVAMERAVLLGVNLACVYGIGLIVLALLLALVYDLMCRREEALHRSKEADAK
jgi:uncharacterized membrane protein (DUF485 family)